MRAILFKTVKFTGKMPIYKEKRPRFYDSKKRSNEDFVKSGFGVVEK